MPAKPEPKISAALLSNLFARFTADRDALLAAVERCELRLTELSQRLTGPLAPEPKSNVDDRVDEALSLAKEALAMAREAMRAVEYSRRD